MPSVQEQLLRKAFLRNFVITLIENSISKEETEKIRKEVQKISKKIKKEPKKSSSERHKKRVMQIAQKETMQKPTVVETATLRGKKPVSPVIQQISPPVQAPTQKTSKGVYLGKITSILQDPSVFAVECPGPGKNLLVNRGGAVQTAPTVLTKDEIDTIIGGISEQTKIPLTSGLFRAAIQNLIVSAVLSEYIGTRFIMQKRTPFTRY